MGPRNVELTGLAVDVVVSDPWDLTSPEGSVRFPARVMKAATHALGASEERLLLRFREAVKWHGGSYRFFVARHRRGLGLEDDLLAGRPVECSLVAVSEEHAASTDPLDTTWWRGGLAVLATLVARVSA